MMQLLANPWRIGHKTALVYQAHNNRGWEKKISPAVFQNFLDLYYEFPTKERIRKHWNSLQNLTKQVFTEIKFNCFLTAQFNCTLKYSWLPSDSVSAINCVKIRLNSFSGKNL